MRYAFDNLFSTAGDLRLYLAAEATGTDGRTEFEAAREVDGLISESLPGRLTYAEDYVSKRIDAIQECVTNSTNLYVIADRQDARVAYMRNVAGTHINSTVVLCGSGPNYNKAFTEGARRDGALIISMGTNIAVNTEAHYWIAGRTASAYPSLLWRLTNTTKIAPLGTQDDKYFHDAHGKWVGKEFCRVPNTLFYQNEGHEVGNLSTPDNCAELSNFGFDSTFGLGLTLALSLGAHNIIFNGVELSPGKTGNYWYNKATSLRDKEIDRKNKVYPRLRKRLKQVLGYAKDKQARMYTIHADANFPHTSYIHADRLSGGIKREVSRDCPSADLEVPRLTHSEREEVSELTKRFNKNQLVGGHFVTKLHKFIEEYPEEFDSPAFRTTAGDLKARLAKASCSMCTKNKMGRGSFAVMAKLVYAGDQKAIELWEKHLPEFLILRNGPKHYAHSGSQHLLDRYNELKEK
jgi:hypothetical protein